MDPYEIPRGAVIVSGKPYPCAARVKGWKETGLEFRPGRGARKRQALPNLIVLHHTGGEGDAAGVYRVLNERGLGIEFVIDREGVVWQHCDPALVDTFDAGNINARSIGIEMISCGLAPLPKASLDRGTYSAKINGHEFTFAKFYEKQLVAMGALLDTLTLACRIPRVFATAPGLLDPEAMRVHRGVLGHYHASAIKTDPGTQPFDWLRAQGYKAAEHA